MVAFVYAAELAAVLCFVLVFDRLGVVTVARRAFQSAVDASKTVRDAGLSDDEKERAARAASLELLGCFGSITIRSVAALAASVLLLLLFHVSGLARMSDVNSLMLSWPGIVVALAAAAAVYVAKGRM